MNFDRHVTSQHQIKQFFSSFGKGADTKALNNPKGSFRGRAISVLKRSMLSHVNTADTFKNHRQEVILFASNLKKASSLGKIKLKKFFSKPQSEKNTKLLSKFINNTFKAVDKVDRSLFKPTEALASVEKSTKRVQEYLKIKHEGSDFGTKLCDLVSKDSEVEGPSEAIGHLKSKNDQILKDKKNIKSILKNMNKNRKSTYNLFRSRGIDKEEYEFSIKSRSSLRGLFEGNREADKNGVVLNMDEMLTKYSEIYKGKATFQKEALSSYITQQIMDRLPTQRTELLEFVHEHLPPANEGENNDVALRKEEAAVTLISKILAGECDETTNETTNETAIRNHVVGKTSMDKLQALIDRSGYRSLLVSD